MTYETIYERFYTLMTDSNFYKLSENDAYDLMNGWIHNAVSDPYIKKLFLYIELNDEIMELKYQLRNSVDKYSDNEFVVGIFSQYMIISWMKPKVDNAINLATMIGGKEEKMLQSNYKSNIARLEYLEKNYEDISVIMGMRIMIILQEVYNETSLW